MAGEPLRQAQGRFVGDVDSVVLTTVALTRSLYFSAGT